MASTSKTALLFIFFILANNLQAFDEHPINDDAKISAAVNSIYIRKNDPNQSSEDYEIEKEVRIRKTISLYKKMGNAIKQECNPSNYYIFFHGMSYRNSFIAETNTALEKTFNHIPAAVENKTILRAPLTPSSRNAIDVWNDDVEAQKHSVCVSWLRDQLSLLEPKIPGSRSTVGEREGRAESTFIISFKECYQENINNLSIQSKTEIITQCPSSKNNKDVEASLGHMQKEYKADSINSLKSKIAKALDHSSLSKEKIIPKICDRKTFYWDNFKGESLLAADINPSGIGRNESALFFLINNNSSQKINIDKIIVNVLKEYQKLGLIKNDIPESKLQEFIVDIQKEFDELGVLGENEKIGLMQVICLPQNLDPIPFYISSAYGVPLSNVDLVQNITDILTKENNPSVDNHCEKPSENYNDIARGNFLIKPQSYFGYKDKESQKHLYPQARLLAKEFDMTKVKVLTITSLDQKSENILRNIQSRLLKKARKYFGTAK